MKRINAHWTLVVLVVGITACRHAGTSGNEPAPESARSAAAAEQYPCPEQPPAGWTRLERPRRFIGQDLFNHIDGAAEMFLEMGFRQLFLQRYRSGEATLDLEVYEMTDPTAARGMYLRFRGAGRAVPGVAGRNYGNQYQLAAQKHRYFVQVNNPHGDPHDVPAMAELANGVLEAVPDDQDVSVLGLLPAEGRIPGSEAIIGGPFALQSVYTLGEGDVLLLQGRIRGVAADYQTEREGRFTRLLVRYGSAGEASAAYRHLLQQLDPSLRVLRQDEQSAVFTDSDKRFGLVAVRADTLEICVRLTRDPGAESLRAHGP